MKRMHFTRNRTFIVIFLSVCLVYVIYNIYLYNAPRQVHYSRVSSINLKEENLGGIQLLQSIKTLSPEPAPARNEDNDLYPYFTIDNGTTVATMRGDDEIILISAYSDHTMKTAKGIGVDSPLEDVIAAYGTSYYKRGEQGAAIIGYLDKTSHRNLEFWLHDHKVNMIRYSLDSIIM